MSRSAIYLAVSDGNLRAVTAVRRTLVLAKDLRAWLEKLPRNPSDDGAAASPSNSCSMLPQVLPQADFAAKQSFEITKLSD
jgi:hypothetical protein